jgi:glycosyltransferase involved in cell wall biosynthesis
MGRLSSLIAARKDAISGGRRPVVALVTDSVFPYHCGGKESRYHELLSRLASRAELHVYTMNWWQGPRRRADGFATFHAVCRLHPMYGRGRRSMKQAVFFALGCLRLLTGRFDVLEADHMPYLQILVLKLVTTLRRKRLVVTWHEVWGQDYWRQYLGPVGLLAWLIEWLAMRAPDHIIAASAQTAERLSAATNGRAKLTVAPNGIDLDTISTCPRSGDPVDVVAVGRLIEHKRIDLLLEAIAELHASGYPVTCRIIGDGPDNSALHAQAESLGLTSAVEFRHDVREQKDLYGLMKSARVFAFPSAREGFGIAVLEAIACGLPVATTSAPDNLARHLVTDYARGAICEPTVTAFTECLRELLTGSSDPGDEAGASTESWLASFSWNETASLVAAALRI